MKTNLPAVTWGKRLVGVGLLRAAELFPSLKPSLKHWGLRTRMEWFDGRIVSVQMPDGRSFKLASLPGDYLSFELFWRGAGYYEPISVLVAGELARPGVTCLDIGANMGFYTLALSLGRPGDRVVAFEPNPRLFELLRRNVAVNRLTHVRCEPMAMSDADGAAKLYLSASNMSASLRSDFDYHPTGASVEVTTTALDAYCARNDVRSPLLIKLDVEGHEEAVFRGAQRVVSLLRPDILVEVTYPFSESTLGLLRGAGYRFYPITDQGCLEAAALTPVVRDRLVFLNYLLSARPRSEIEGVFERISDRVRRIDLTQTSKFVTPEIAEQFQARERLLARPAPAPPARAISGRSGN